MVRVNGYAIWEKQAALRQAGFDSADREEKATSSQIAQIFCLGQCRKGDGSRGGTVFDVEFAQDVFDVLADRPGACAEDHPDLMVRFTLCDPSQNLRFSRRET